MYKDDDGHKHKNELKVGDMMEKKSSIQMICDSYVSLDDAVLHNYIAERYSFPLIGMIISEESLDNFKSDMKTYDISTKINTLDISPTTKYIYMESHSFFLEMVYDDKNKNWSVNVYANQLQTIEDVLTYCKKYEPSGVGITLVVDNYSLDSHGEINIRKDMKEKSDIYEASKLYYPYLNTDILFKKYSYSNESILMLVGDTGLGKTKLVALFERFMFDNPTLFPSDEGSLADDDVFRMAYVKNEDILALDSFWEEIYNTKYNIIFLDDADECLMPRESESYTQEDINRKKFMSQLLSFTDGIDSSHNTKVIITTNRPANLIDKAALRRGRTFDILQLKPLTKSQAKSIWENSELSVEKFEEIFKKDSITQSELGAEIQIHLKLKEIDEMDFGDYLLEDGISLVHKYRVKDSVIKI